MKLITLTAVCALAATGALAAPLLQPADGGTGATTAAGARANLGAAASGANSDITSLSALSTPLSQSQGGLGSNDGTHVKNFYTGSQSPGNFGAFAGKIRIQTGPQNAIVGMAVQDGTNGNSFPTGVTGWGTLIGAGAAGNQAFGGFFQCDIYVAGGCQGAEINTYNYAGTPSVATLPPVVSFGTTAINPITLQIVGKGTYPSLFGIYMTGSNANPNYLIGQYFAPKDASYAQLYIDAATNIGPSFAAAYIANSTGTAPALMLQSIGTSMNKFNYAFEMLDYAGAMRVGFNQLGDMYGRAWIANGQSDSKPTPTTCTGAGSGATCTVDSTSTDGAFTLTITAGTTPSATGLVRIPFTSNMGATTSGCIFNLVTGTGTSWAADSSPPIIDATGQGIGFVQIKWKNGTGAGTNLTSGSTYVINGFCPAH